MKDIMFLRRLLVVVMGSLMVSVGVYGEDLRVLDCETEEVFVIEEAEFQEPKYAPNVDVVYDESGFWFELDCRYVFVSSYGVMIPSLYVGLATMPENTCQYTLPYWSTDFRLGDNDLYKEYNSVQATVVESENKDFTNFKLECRTQCCAPHYPHNYAGFTPMQPVYECSIGQYRSKRKDYFVFVCDPVQYCDAEATIRVFTHLKIRVDFSNKAPNTLVPGKSWIMAEHRTDLDAGIDYMKYYKAECVATELMEDGATKATLRTYYFGNESNYQEYFLKEKDGVIEDVLDFNAKVGDEIPAAGTWVSSIKIVGESTCKVNGKDVKVLAVKRGANLSGSWVESVGVQTDDLWITPPDRPTHSDYALFTSLEACYKDGVEIFSRRDFLNPVDVFERPLLLSEGKEWLIESTWDNGGKQDTKCLTAKVAGDVATLGVDAKRIVVMDTEGVELTSVIAREQYGIFYIQTAQGDFVPAINFSAYRGEEVSQPNDGKEYLMVLTSGKKVNGVECRELVVAEKDNIVPGHAAFSWVEGVGSSTCDWLIGDYKPEDGSQLVSARLLECRMDGKVIFTAADFSYPTHSSLTKIESYQSDADEFYDLQGRAVKFPVKGRLYIRGGRVVLEPIR